jgi:hypothetical protein
MQLIVNNCNKLFSIVQKELNLYDYKTQSNGDS